jgi:hypothetical protein
MVTVFIRLSRVKRHAICVARLRKRMTEAENLFCRHLAELGLGYRFQQGFYSPYYRIVDFYLPDQNLIIEIGGIIEIDGPTTTGIRTASATTCSPTPGASRFCGSRTSRCLLETTGPYMVLYNDFPNPAKRAKRKYLQTTSFESTEHMVPIPTRASNFLRRNVETQHTCAGHPGGCALAVLLGKFMESPVSATAVFPCFFRPMGLFSLSTLQRRSSIANSHGGAAAFPRDTSTITSVSIR